VVDGWVVRRTAAARRARLRVQLRRSGGLVGTPGGARAPELERLWAELCREEGWPMTPLRYTHLGGSGDGTAGG
jgi:hypothetical protein